MVLSGTDITLVRQIECEAQSLPHIGEPIPARWVDVRQAIETDNRNHINLEQFEQLCQEQDITNLQDIDVLLAYFHDLGIVLHFNENPLLRQRVILKSEWATQAIYRIFDHDIIKAKEGRFSRQDCIQLWSDPQYRNMHDVLLEIMKNFQLVYEIQTTGQLVAPQMLPENSPDYPWNQEQNQPMQFRYDLFMPQGIFWKFVVEMYPYITNHDWVWRNGVILTREGTQAEIIENWSDRRIYIRLVGPNITEFRAIISDKLDQISQTFHRLVYEKMIPCNCSECKESSDPHFYQYSKLKAQLDRGRRITTFCDNSDEEVFIRPLLEGFDHPIQDVFPGTNTINRENEMQTITIFLASSSELESDRREFEILVGRLNKDYIQQGLFLKLEIWEDFLDSMSQTRLQDEYNKAVQSSDIFVSLFHTKVGKFTAEEFETAFKSFQENERPYIYTYFKDESARIGTLDRDDLQSLWNFEDKLKTFGHYPTKYTDINDLKLKFTNQLKKLLPKL